MKDKTAIKSIPKQCESGGQVKINGELIIKPLSR